MCLIGLAVDPPGPWRLIVAANRDEFHGRLAAPAAWWIAADATSAAGAAGATRAFEPGSLLAGRDLQGGGTWLGLRRAAGGSLRVSALTNLRAGLMPAVMPLRPEERAAAPSRGALVAGYLAGEEDPEAFLCDMDPPPGAYAGFNLLAISLAAGAGDVVARYLNNLPGSRIRRLPQGIHMVSNATVDVPWPKTRRLEAALVAALAGAPLKEMVAQTRTQGDEWLLARLLTALGDRTVARTANLPCNGLDPDREQLLSAPFIVDDHYGTRCSTVLMVGRDGRVTFTESSFGPGGQPLGTVTERFVI